MLIETITWQMVDFHVDDPLELKKAIPTLVEAIQVKWYDV